MPKKQNVLSPNKTASSTRLVRLQTGVPRLDVILKGGFIRGNTYTLLGPPGSGKTILANQVCFHHIQAEQGRCVYMTLLAETHAKMTNHLSTLEFYDPSIVGEHLIYLSGYSTLKVEGLSGTLDLIRRTLREQSATFFVLDGVQAVRKAVKDPAAYDEFLHELQASMMMLQCTAILLNPTAAVLDAPSENTVVDGVVELSYQLVGPRAVRELTVHKFRGTDYLLGRHEVEITRSGVQIHPRTEIQFSEPPQQADENRVRMPFGVDSLDQMLGGGLLSGTATTLLGSPGTGKTMLGLSFLIEGALKGQRGVYFGFYEPPPRLIEKAERVGLPLRKYVENGSIVLVWQPPLEHFMDSLAERLIETLNLLKPTVAERRRLFVDGIEGFRAAAVYPERMPRFLSALSNQLRMADVTTVISEELDLFRPEVIMPNPEVATVNEGVILLRYVEMHSQIHRLISILKMRESAYDTSIREFEILDDGVTVSDSFESAEALLSGKPHLVAPAPKKAAPSPLTRATRRSAPRPSRPRHRAQPKPRRSQT